MYSLVFGYYCNQKWGPAARSSKANKEARLVERKVCFILDASNRGGGGGGGGRQMPVQRPTSPPSPATPTIRGKALLQTEGGGYMQKQHSQL